MRLIPIKGAIKQWYVVFLYHHCDSVVVLVCFFPLHIYHTV